MSNKVTAKEIIELVQRLPDVEEHIFEFQGKQCITQEWLCGGFAGVGFDGETLEEATNKMIDYLYEHIGHDSMVGKVVTNSGFPDLKRVEWYCKELNQSEEV